MTQLTRRNLLAGTAAAGLAAAMPTQGHAAAPQAGKQAAGFYRYKVGSIEITVVTDGANRFPIPDGFVANASKEQINAALAANFMEQGFFNGPYNPIVINTGTKLALVDTGTSEATLERCKAVGERLGKDCIVVRDFPGFATSRLDVLSAIEAIRMLEDGVASAEDIDKAMVTAFRHPVGPLKLTDIVGLDVRLDIAKHLSSTLGDRFAPPRLLADMVTRGELGVKSGRGFYDWQDARAFVSRKTGVSA